MIMFGTGKLCVPSKVLNFLDEGSAGVPETWFNPL